MWKYRHPVVAEFPTAQRVATLHNLEKLLGLPNMGGFPCIIIIIVSALIVVLGDYELSDNNLVINL